MNCSVGISVNGNWQGDNFPKQFVGEVISKTKSSNFVFCQKRANNLMYYAWGRRKNEINVEIFVCYNGLMIAFDETNRRKLSQKSRGIAFDDREKILEKAEKFFRELELSMFMPIPLLSYEKQAVQKSFPKFDVNELNKYTDTNSTVFVIIQKKKDVSRKKNRVLISIYIIVIGSVLVMMFHDLFSDHSDTEISTETITRTELKEGINELNKSLPIEIEDGIRWMFTSVQGSSVVFLYQMSYEEDFEGLNGNSSKVRENIKAVIKSADKDMVEFLEALYLNGFGVILQFRLKDTDRTIVVAIDARELKSIIER